MVTRRVRISLLAVVAGATLVGSSRVVIADVLPPAAAGTFVACIDRFQNQRNVPATEPCKPGETRTPLTGQTDQSDHPDVSLEPLQAQINALVAKVAALQAQVDQNKKDQDKPDPDQSPPPYAVIDKKTGKPVGSPIKEIVPGANSSDAGLQQMPGQKGGAKNNQAGSSASTVKNRVTAPFEVVDSKGNVMLRVAEDAQTPQGARVTIGSRGTGGSALRVFNASGQLVSGVGQDAAGGGLVVVADSAGPVAMMNATARSVRVFKGTQTVAELATNDSGGQVSAYATNGTPLAVMQAIGSGGDLLISRPDGVAVLEATVRGQSGEACVGRGAALRERCLGVGLPLQIN
jgi:hypothetical protein